MLPFKTPMSVHESLAQLLAYRYGYTPAPPPKQKKPLIQGEKLGVNNSLLPTKLVQLIRLLC